MDLDRTSLGERSQELRPRPQQAQEKADAPTDAPPSAEPEHGGALASNQLDPQEQQEPDPEPESRRQAAHEAITRFLSLPNNTELDIQVDTEEQEVVVKIRDKSTGELIREVPEQEAASLFEKLREHHGALIDRSY